MADTSVITNGHFSWLAGPDAAITEEHWDSGPTLTELQALVNYSETVKIDGTDFGLQESETAEDRSFADQAGAQSRGALQASGSLEIYTPGEGDTTSIHAQGWNTFATPRTRLALAQRPVTPQKQPIAPGDEVNIFRVITDGGTHNRNDASRTLGTSLVLQDDIHVNYIVPSATPTAPAVTPAGPYTVAVGGVQFIEVAYEGRNVTVGAKYVSSNENIVRVTQNGIIYGVAAGSATVTVSVAGGATLAPLAVTVTAGA